MRGSLPAPVRRSLTEPHLKFGLPLGVGLTHWCLSSLIIAPGQQFWFIPVALVVHLGLALLTKHDPYAIPLFLTAVRSRRKRIDP